MASTPPLERAPLRERIQQVVRERVVRGELAPGAAVRDWELAAELDASRTPVREALVRLAAEGLLETRAGRGFRVPPLSRREIEEVHGLIEVFEPLALGLAPPATSSQQGELERLTVRLESGARTPLEWNALDTGWHRALIAGCPNQRLLRYVEELREVLRRYELAYLRGAGSMEPSAREHRAIARAFAAGEREQAGRLLAAHWRRGWEELLSIIPEGDRA
jgi:DNA-binding GntR family transcriptional regulator